MESNHSQIQSRFKGAIPLLRKFCSHPFWKEKRKFSRAEAWIDLLFMARYGTTTEEIWDRGEVIKLQYAQVLTSTITLANQWKRSRGWVSSFIENLTKKQSILIIEMNNRRTILQIVNMGRIKKILQGKEQQLIQLDLQQENGKMTHKNNENKVNKGIIREVPPINNFFSLFKEVNPSYKLLYSNKTERKSMERLIAQYGQEQLHQILFKLPSIVQMPYAPKITTPYELELKMGKLLLFMKQEKVKEQKGGVTKV